VVIIDGPSIFVVLINGPCIFVVLINGPCISVVLIKGARRGPDGHAAREWVADPHPIQELPTKRESSLLTTYWSEST